MTARREGSCYGYRVTSSVPLECLRRGPGEPLEVLSDRSTSIEPRQERPLLEWAPSPGHDFAARLYADGESGHREFWIDGVGSFGIDPAAPRVTMPAGADPIRRETRLWGVPASLCFTQRGDLSLHAAAVDVGGKALLLAAPGRFGKTTLASAFLAQGHRLLSEDLSCCRLRGPLSVLPGPALLRVRPDVYERIALPHTRVAARDPERVYLLLDEEVRGDASPVPLAGLVLLRIGPQLRVKRVDAARCLQDLWVLSFNLPTDADRKRSFEALTGLAARVPVWELERPLEFDLLPRVVDHIVDRCVP